MPLKTDKLNRLKELFGFGQKEPEQRQLTDEEEYDLMNKLSPDFDLSDHDDGVNDYGFDDACDTCEHDRDRWA